VTCDRCGKELELGEWPFCGGKNNHGFAHPQNNFIPYYDVGLGEHITSLAHRWRVMKQQGVKERDVRDLMTPGDLSARKDRIAELKRERTR